MIQPSELTEILDTECELAFKKASKPMNKLYSKYCKDIKKLVYNFRIDLDGESFDEFNSKHLRLLKKLNKDIDKRTTELYDDIKPIFDKTIDKVYDKSFKVSSRCFKNHAKMDEAVKKRDIEFKWSGSHYSEIIEFHRQQLSHKGIAALNKSITDGELKVKNYSAIYSRINSAVGAMSRLYVSEIQACRTISQVTCFRANGVEEVKIVLRDVTKHHGEYYTYIRTVDDKKRCKFCESMDNKVVRIAPEGKELKTKLEKKVGKRMIGTKLPPYHPHCRCSIQPIMSLNAEKEEEDK